MTKVGAPNTFTAGLDFGVYLSLPGVSQSELKHMKPTPAHYKAYKASNAEKPPSPSQQLGTLVHHAILEPDTPFPDVAVKPADMKFSTKDGKAWKAEQEAAGREIITEDGFNAVNGMIKSICEHQTARAIFSGEGQRELSCFATHETRSGEVLKKCRLDFVPHGNSLVDIKTTKDAELFSFGRDAFKFGYHIQGAFYLDIWNKLHPDDQRVCFCFVVVENVPPHGCRIFTLEPDAIEHGRNEYRALIERYAECCAVNSWPGYPAGIETLHLPKWMRKEEAA